MSKVFELFKKLSKKKSFWLISIILIGVIIYFASKSGEKIEYVTEPVKRGDLRQTVSETGTVSPKSMINLNFKGNGTITQINVKEGDEIKAGDILARLDAGPIEIQVRQAQANLAIAQANLNKFLAGASEQDIKVSEEQVNNALITYENAKRDQEALLNKLDSDIKNYEQAVISSRENLITSLDKSLVAADYSLDVIKVIFDDINLRPLFSVENHQYKVDADNYYDRAVIELIVAKNYFNQARNTLADQDIDQAVNQALKMLDVLAQSLNSTFLALGASLTSFNFNDLALANYKSNVKLEQNNTTASVSSIQTTNQAFKNSQISMDTALNNKQLNIANSKSAVDSSLGAYNLAKAQLDLKKAAPRQVDIAYYQAQVAQAQVGLDFALTNLNDYIIRAPTDGLVVFVNNEVGEQIGFGLTDIATAAKPVIAMLGKSDFEIKVDVPESEIIKIKPGDLAEIILDAYGDDFVFPGNVVFIDIAETIIQGVVYYKVTVEMDETDKEIKSGMTANVDIITAEKEDVLFVPRRAVKEDLDGLRYVEILKNGQAERANVSIGLRGDEGTEILSGLNEGQEVIIYKREK
ncbi:MAG TPA: efflux RND transporter periplasmic adaptor subunit [Candidatus Uhrbacteria bacterium]|nr:efflux RND transporter periplasmic adaptor subunit [Candidatus Uhrbacteria bacterium]